MQKQDDAAPGSGGGAHQASSTSPSSVLISTAVKPESPTDCRADPRAALVAELELVLMHEKPQAQRAIRARREQ